METKKDQVFGLKKDGHLLQGAVQSPQKRPIFLRAFSATCNLVVTINRISITQENCRSKMIVSKVIVFAIILQSYLHLIVDIVESLFDVVQLFWERKEP